MAYSTCAKCGNNHFEIKENSPVGSRYKLMFVQCASCGSVVGVMEYYNIGTKLEELEKKVSSLSSGISTLSTINGNIAIVNQNINNLANRITALSEKIDKNDK